MKTEARTAPVPGIRRGGTGDALRGNGRGGFPLFPVGVLFSGHHHVSPQFFPLTTRAALPIVDGISRHHLRTPQPVPTLRIPGGGGVRAPRDLKGVSDRAARALVAFGPYPNLRYKLHASRVHACAIKILFFLADFKSQACPGAAWW